MSNQNTHPAAIAPADAREHTQPSRKTLFIIDTLLGMGGAEGALQKLVAGLPKLGYECSIAAFQVLNDPDFLKLFPCVVHDFAVRRTYGLSGLRAAFHLKRLVSENRFDIIHTIFPTSDLWAAPIAKFAGKGSVLVSGRRDMGIMRNGLHKVLYRCMGGLYDQVQTVSEEVRRMTITQDGISPERVACVYNGVEFDRIMSTEPQRDLFETFALDPLGMTVVTAVGRVWPVKGIDVVIRAAARVCRDFPHTNFVVAGGAEQDYTAQLQELARSLGVGRNIYFLGRTKKIISVLKAADIFCLLSRSEGMSNALLEAMACGLPCVATAVGGNPEVLSPNAGFLVESENAEAAAVRLAQLLRDAALRKRMGAAGQQLVRVGFTDEIMMQRVAELYQYLLASRPKIVRSGTRFATHLVRNVWDGRVR